MPLAFAQSLNLIELFTPTLDVHLNCLEVVQIAGGPVGHRGLDAALVVVAVRALLLHLLLGLCQDQLVGICSCCIVALIANSDISPVDC